MGSSNPNDHGKLKISNKTQAKIFHITRKNVSMFSLTEGWLLYLVGWVKELINNSPWPSTYLVNRSGIKDELRGTLSPTKTRKDVLLDLKHWLYWIDRKNVKRDVVPDRNQGKYISWPTVSDLSKRLYPPLFFVLTLITINEGEQRKYYQHYTIYMLLQKLRPQSDNQRSIRKVVRIN